MNTTQDVIHAAYYSALEADDAYEAAIKTQFGKSANRSDYPQKDYNEDTLAAFKKKVSADAAFFALFRAKQAQGSDGV